MEKEIGKSFSRWRICIEQKLFLLFASGTCTGDVLNARLVFSFPPSPPHDAILTLQKKTFFFLFIAFLPFVPFSLLKNK
jgi:hypothetical protein